MESSHFLDILKRFLVHLFVFKLSMRWTSWSLWNELQTDFLSDMQIILTPAQECRYEGTNRIWLIKIRSKLQSTDQNQITTPSKRQAQNESWGSVEERRSSSALFFLGRQKTRGVNMRSSWADLKGTLIDYFLTLGIDKMCWVWSPSMPLHWLNFFITNTRWPLVTLRYFVISFYPQGF